MKNLLALALLPTLTLAAQEGTVHAPDGGVIQRLQSVDIFPKPGAGFTAFVDTEWTRQRADGTTFTVKNHRTVARDSAGRVFQERRYLAPNGDQQETRISELQYDDPVLHERTLCRPENKTCTIMPFNRPPSAAIVPTGALAGGRGNVTRESLGTQNTNNLDLVGSREILMPSQAVTGTQRPEPTVKEFWYSPRLEVNIVTKRFEPIGGSQTITLNNVDLNEPNPELFKPPAGYKFVHTVEGQ